MHSQRGFIGIGVLIAIIVGLAVLSGGAYFIAHQQSSSQITSEKNVNDIQTLPTTNNQAQQTQSAANTYAQTSQEIANSAPIASDTTYWRPVSALPSSYQINGWTWYWMSEDGSLHCMNQVVLGADAKTFVVSTYGEYAKDQNHVYRCAGIVKDADTASFSVLNKDYAKDRTHVFYSGGIVNGADSASFEIVPTPTSSSDGRTSFGKDKNHVYYLSQEIQSADPETFTILSPLIPKDKNWIYQNGKVFGPATLIDETYAHTLPQNCQKSAYHQHVDAALVPPLFSEDGSIVGYTGYSAVCIIDKKTDHSEYYDLGGSNPISLSKDGSKIFYAIGQSEGAAMAGETCKDCGTYSIDRATGKKERVQ